MTKLYLASPFYIKFHPCETEHTVAVVKSFANINNIIKIHGNVKGVIADTYEGAKQKLIKNAREHIDLIVSNFNNKIKPQDFDLHCQITETDAEGNIWTGDGVSTTYSFQN